MEPHGELRALATVELSPCVTLYLNTRTSDPIERERVGLFVRRRVERALSAVDDPETRGDLARALDEARRRLDSVAAARPSAVAIFACRRAGLFRVLELDVPVENELIVDRGPALRQLAVLTGRYERTLLVLVSSEEARIFDVVLGTMNEAASLSSDPFDKQRTGLVKEGWVQNHYQRHVLAHIERHLREVAERATHLADRIHPDLFVVGGVHPTIDRFLHELPARIRTRVTDIVALSPESPLSTIAHTALAAMRDDERRRTADVVRDTIDVALSGGPAALGLDEVLDAAREQRLLSLCLLASYRGAGTRCRDCGSLFRDETACSFCRATCDPVDLGEALVRATIEQDGSVEFLPASVALERLGGVAAKLRW